MLFMKTIRLKFTDFSKNFDEENNYFTKLLRTKYNIEFSMDPDFVIHSVYGYNYLKYKSIRILFTGESNTPDFNLSDYGMGFDWITFDDRYLRLPLYFVRNNSEYYKNCLIPFNYNIADIKNRKFCNFIYSNGNADKKRADFYHELSKYKFIHSGGKYLNNIGGQIDKKIQYQKEFKFSIAFENSSVNGYSTEKILEAKVAGSVPIYWGNPVINKEMNTKAFINCHEYKNFDEVIEFIKHIDNNDTEYLKILNEPLFKKDIYDLNDSMVLDFFENIFSKNTIQRNGSFQQKIEKKYQQYRVYENFKRSKLMSFIIRKLGL